MHGGNCPWLIRMTENSWLGGTHPWQLGMSPPWQGSRVNFGQVRPLCLNPRTCVPLRRWDLGFQYG